MGGDPKRLDAARKPKVPPRTMTRGTGTAEGVPEWALAGGDWFSRHRTNLIASVATVAVVTLGFFGWQSFTANRGAKATQAYNDALGAVFGVIAPEDFPADDPRRNLQRFATFDARARSALEKLRKTARDNGSAKVLPLVRLTEAGSLYQLGRYAEAKQAYLAVIGQDLAGLEGRAVEGLAFTLESLGELDAAMTRYRELQNVQDGLYRDQAQYYQARLMHRRNEGDRAKDMLRAVIERVGRPAASDPTAGQQASLRESALGLLRDIDPNDPAVVAADRQREASEGGGPGHDSHGPPGGRPGSLEGLPPELRQQLEKMLRERGGAGGAPGAPGGGTGAR
jgi:tetratricopeptide (TPR) repeat protein